MPKVTGKSLPVSTRCTPDRETAFEKSIDSIIACAWGERSNFMCSMRGRTMSSAKRVWPVTLARPSTLRRALPMTFMFEPARGFLDRFETLLIPGAAAKVACNGFLDSFPVGISFAVEERFRGHQDPRGAVAALRGAEVGESSLQGMQLRAAAEPFDRLHRAAFALGGEHQAGKLRRAVDQHRAGAALAQLAAVLGAGEAEVLAQHFEKRLVPGAGQLDGLAVDGQAQSAGCAPYCLGPKQIAPTVLQSPCGGKGWRGVKFSAYPARRLPWHCVSATKPPISRRRPPKARSTSTNGSATSGRSCSRIPRTSPRSAPPS